MVVKGQIIDAFEHYFDENVVTHSNAGDRSKNKSQKREWLIKFFSLIQKVDKIELHGQTIAGNVTHSKFTFEFTTTWGASLVWNEIIRRTWKNDLVIDEYYYEGELPVVEKDKKTKKTTKKAAATKPTAKKTAKATTRKVAKTTVKEVTKSEAKKVVKPAAKKVAKPDDLKKVEGIGPKIAQLLIDDGIKTFAKLAVTSQTRLKKILLAAGPRYKMHNPATWPEQAKLAKEGKWDELNKLQDELKGGRR